MKVTKFLSLTLFMIYLIAVITAGCGKNSNLLGPNNLNNQPSFQINQQTELNGATIFLFKPSINVRISSIVSKYDVQHFADTIKYTNVNYVYSKDTIYVINGYTGVESGQKWIFEFTGSVPGQNNSNFMISTNYTVQ